MVVPAVRAVQKPPAGRDVYVGRRVRAFEICGERGQGLQLSESSLRRVEREGRDGGVQLVEDVGGATLRVEGQVARACAWLQRDRRLNVRRELSRAPVEAVG